MVEAQKEDIEAGQQMFLSQKRFQLTVPDEYLSQSKEEIKAEILAAVKENRTSTPSLRRRRSTDCPFARRLARKRVDGKTASRWQTAELTRVLLAAALCFSTSDAALPGEKRQPGLENPLPFAH